MQTVDATGTLQAVTTVQVGSQVSGTIKALRADFNSRVRKGQIIAELDPSLLQAQVEQAQAALVRSQADVDRARILADDSQVKVKRARELFAAQLIPRVDLEAAESAVREAEASIKAADAQVVQARASLNQNKVNLAHAIITAPIDGIVVSRNVDVGQTVAASLSAPQLFLIANDLSQMQILASVDEADIGAIRDGVPVRFTVQSYPSRSFTGTVRQVRLQSTTRENVVNYTVVVAVANPEARLLPGMTATARFVTDSAIDVLTVPNAALRFRPSGTIVTTSRTGRGDSAIGRRAIPRAGRGGSARPESTRQQSQTATSETDTDVTLWTLDAAGKPAALRVRAGLSDGQRTAVAGPGLDAGLRVIVGMAEAERTTTSGAAGSTNPLQPAPTGGPRRPGGF